MRWPSNIPADLAAFSNSVTGTFSHGHYRSPPTTASTLKHYSPLQQNSDRAADPFATGSAQKRPNSESPSSNMPSSPWNPLLSDLLADDKDIVQNLEEDCALQDEESATVLSKVDEEEEELLSRMGTYSVKTLTSLASYPNPYQKVAQLALDRARNMFKTATLDASRTISPSLSRQGHEGAGGPRGSGFSRENSDHFSCVPRNGHVGSSNRSSVLSNGPGAPQPLTAGPPGQRQYKASTLEAPFRALQGNLQNSSSPSIDEAHFEINTPTLLNLGTASIAKAPESSAILDRHDVLSQQTPQSKVDAFGNIYPWYGYGPSYSWHRAIRDTKTLDQIKEYYPHGAPPTLYDPKNIVSVPEDNSDLLYVSRLAVLRQKLSFLGHTKMDTHHRARFYSGVPELTKTWEERLEDIREKLRRQQLGIRGTHEISPPLNLTEISKPRDVPIERVNALKTHEAADPLLGMAFSTLSNYWENGLVMDIPTGFKEVNTYDDEDNGAPYSSMSKHNT